MDCKKILHEEIGQDAVFDRILDFVLSKKTQEENSFEDGFRYGLKLFVQKKCSKSFH